ncbi:peptidase inhibitor family I36 protein [Streptomyces coeruleoprunus]|uniref:Peptidase inhibitor family I36 protein n=1 Tax=Streptomyces coeruleoprunus TaxID=285563 RepID=A0ABV9XJU3_9ACTN
MRRSRRLLSLAAAAGAAALLPLAGPAAPAQAADAVCAAGYLCVWDQTSYEGRKAVFKDTNKSWAGYFINNKDASWANAGTSGLNACVWGDEYSMVWGWGGGVKVISAGTSSAKDAYRAYKGSSNSWGNC